MKPEIIFDPKRHTYTIDGKLLPSVTGILKATGIQTFPVDEIPAHILERARFRGIAVHAAIEHLERTYWMTETPEIARPYLRAYGDFLDDTGWRTVLREQPVCSLVHRYAGRLDNLGFLSGVRSIVDMKTGNCVGQQLEAAKYQNAAYVIAWNELNPQEQVREAYVVTLSPRYHLHEVDLGLYRGRFIDAVRKYHRMKEAEDDAGDHTRQASGG